MKWSRSVFVLCAQSRSRCFYRETFFSILLFRFEMFFFYFIALFCAFFVLFTHVVCKCILFVSIRRFLLCFAQMLQLYFISLDIFLFFVFHSHCFWVYIYVFITILFARLLRVLSHSFYVWTAYILWKRIVELSLTDSDVPNSSYNFFPRFIFFCLLFVYAEVEGINSVRYASVGINSKRCCLCVMTFLFFFLSSIVKQNL